MPTKDIKDYLPHFAKKMTKEMEAYVIDEVFLESRYIFVHRDNKGQQHGYCTHCKNESKTEDLKHNKKAICPKCKSICTAKHSGRGRKYLKDNAYFVWFEKSVVNPNNTIVAQGIYAERDYREDYTNVKTEYRVKTWYIFDINKGGIMFGEPRWVGEHKQYYQQYKSVYSYFYKYSPNITRYSDYHIIYAGVSKESIREAVKDTPYSWSGWETYYNICNNSGYGCCGEDSYYKSKDIVKFFDLYSRYPCIEYLIKLGFVELVIGKLEKEFTYRTINWRGKNITSVMKMDKHQLQEIKKKKIHVTYLFLNLLQKSKSFGWNLTIEEIGEITMISSKYYTDELEKIFNMSPLSSITSPKKIVNYLKKQVTKFPDHFPSNVISGVIITFRDYIDDCKNLEADLTKENTIFPRDLYAAHQNTIKQIQYKEDQELNKKIKKRSKELSEYYFIDKRLLIRPAGSTKELIEEGKALNHCVGGYAARYADGENILLFIRKTAEPDKPYYTVEIIKDKVIQVWGEDNCNPTEDVTKFMKKFEKIKLNKKNTRKKNKLPVPA